MTDTSRPILVFTDMDGTLLDHHDYSFDAALPALERLNAAGIPVIMNTSKTYSELVVWRERLASQSPFIVENGAAAFIPEALLAEMKLHQNSAILDGLDPRPDKSLYVMEMGPGRTQILERIHHWRQQFGFEFEGFSDFSVQKLCDLTGLSQDDARCALERGYSEPICWYDSEAQWQKFTALLEAEGLQVLVGGRFSHIMGRCDKGRAMRALAQLLYPEGNALCIALGDSGNDIAMLAEADYGVVIRSPVHAPLEVLSPRGSLLLSDAEGPVGWNSSMHTILDELAV